MVEEFVEPGASATTAQRPELQRLLAHVTDGEPTIDVVVVHKLDRMARSIEDHVAIRATLKRSGARLASVTENVDGSVSGQLIENIMASFAQCYSENLATEVKKGMRQKVPNGVWPHRPPRGYVLRKRPDGIGNEIEIHPNDGPLMRRAFELYGSGWHSMRAVAALLARDGLLSRNGGPIPQAHFRRLLASSFYTGKVRWHELECPGRHVQEERTALSAAEMRLTDGFTAGDVSPAIYKARIAQARTRQATLEHASERTSVSAEQLAEAVARALQLATSLSDLYEQFDDVKRAELLRGVFSAIVVDHNGVVGVTLKPPFDALMRPRQVRAS